MESLDSGFAIGGRRHAWGITLTELVAIQNDVTFPSETCVLAPCGEALGLAATSAEATAPRPDRPVLQIKYELAPVDGVPLPDPAVFAGHLTERFGAPGETSEYEIPTNGDTSGSVRFYSNWKAGDCSVGLSLYGAPRQTSHGLGPGCLWLSWSPVKAAQPYLGEWRARAGELARRQPADIIGFRFGATQFPVFGGGREAAWREANYALYHPELLTTPPSIAALIGENGAAFWRYGDDNWCASTAWDTAVLQTDTAVEIRWNDIAPAKGGGFSEIAIGGWSVRDYHGSRPIRDALDRLKTTGGVRIEHLTGYDC
ncbi:MAG: hypothetical protein WDZ83_17990 [Rhizobiaceae bacterium]